MPVPVPVPVLMFVLVLMPCSCLAHARVRARARARARTCAHARPHARAGPRRVWKGGSGPRFWARIRLIQPIRLICLIRLVFQNVCFGATPQRCSQML